MPGSCTERWAPRGRLAWSRGRFAPSDGRRAGGWRGRAGGLHRAMGAARARTPKNKIFPCWVNSQPTQKRNGKTLEQNTKQNKKQEHQTPNTKHKNEWKIRNKYSKPMGILRDRGDAPQSHALLSILPPEKITDQILLPNFPQKNSVTEWAFCPLTWACCTWQRDG